jgi:hypothetical protein
MKLMLVLIFSTFSLTTLACEISIPDKFSLAISPKEGSFFAYNAAQTLQEIPVVRAFNCSKLAMTNKFLMIAFGPQNKEFTDRVGIFDYANNYRDSGCFINNSPFKKTLTFNDRNQNLQDRWKYIKSCYEIHVEEEANTPLNMPKEQPGCTYKQTGKNKMSFNGGFCFVKPGFGSSFLIKFSLKEECKNFEDLSAHNLKTSDLETMLNFYSSGDTTGESIDLTAISTLPLRLTIAPDERLLPASDDYGIATPQFPVNYSVPDIHFGNPEGKLVAADRVQMRLPLWVDNNCQKVCSNNNCTSACDYAQPIVGNMDYFELKNGKEEFLTSWYEGGVAQPGYQGEISGLGFEVPTELAEVGKTYRYRMSFNDPKYDFEKLKNRIRTRLGTMEQDIGAINRGQIHTIPETPAINEISKFPTIEPIPGLVFTPDNFNSIDRATEALRNYLSFKLWPPYYNLICSPTDGNNCHGMKDNYLTLEMDVKILSYNEEEKTYRYEVLKIERKSEVLPGYSRTSPLIPAVKCPF